jgi:hypothetical protein
VTPTDRIVGGHLGRRCAPTGNAALQHPVARRRAIPPTVVQWLFDDEAKEAERGFAHAAIAYNKDVALEAVPAPDSEERNPTEKAFWTKVDLKFGVRVIPIQDLLMEAWKMKYDFVVLRSPRAVMENPNLIDFLSPSFAARVGSGYSLDDLKDPIAAYIGQELGTLGDLANWSAPARDLATEMQLTAEMSYLSALVHLSVVRYIEKTKLTADIADAFVNKMKSFADDTSDKLLRNLRRHPTDQSP